jgi:predicted transcriptional regulator
LLAFLCSFFVKGNKEAVKEIDRGSNLLLPEIPIAMHHFAGRIAWHVHNGREKNSGACTGNKDAGK